MTKRIFASIFAAVAMGWSTFAMVGCSEQELFTPQASAGITQMQESGGMKIGEGKDDGIKLTSAKLSASDYGEYGITPMAESAYILTATVTPSDAVNQGVAWSVTWSNANATWAAGKTPADYVAVMPTDNSKIVSVSCLQPFGAQITITASSEDDPSVKATCTVDYAQKVTGVNLSFGNIPIHLGGETYVKYEVSPLASGTGGKIQANVETCDVYTIGETFVKSVNLSYAEQNGERVYFGLKTGHPMGMDFTVRDNFTNWYGKEVYFDYKHDICNWFIMQRTGDISFDNLTVAEIMEEFENIKEATMYEITFTISGKYSSYTYTSLMKCSGCTNSTAANSISLDSTGYVF